MNPTAFLHRLRDRGETERDDGPPGQRLLNVGDMQRLRHLEFSTRRRVRGTYLGRHSSRQRGQSVEFNEYRQYLPGDDPADLDWKVFARTDRLYVRLYEHESEMTTTLLIDGSASMAFRGCEAPAPGVTQSSSSLSYSKYELAASLAAALAFLLIERNDRVSLGIARNGLATFEAPGMSMTHLSRLLAKLDAHQPALTAQLPEAIETLLLRSRRRGLLVILSDLLDDTEGIFAAIARATARGNEVILVQTLHAEELELPAGGHGIFVDSESGERVRVHCDDVRSSYARAMQAFLERVARMCASLGIDRVPVSTADDRFAVLERYLLRRGAERR
ncbi:MAG: DUF58 domain-containing protein [Phycisphaerae bacterium]|nr:DUF58 domain-containing protein [Phycisphaerae bacterium]